MDGLSDVQCVIRWMGRVMSSQLDGLTALVPLIVCVGLFYIGGGGGGGS
jgi:hypothetical protein